MLNYTRLKNSFLELVAINGASGRENNVADHIQMRLSEIGVQAERDNANVSFDGTCGNVIAFLEGTDPNMRPILLSCHMDTIEPTAGIKCIEENGKIMTDGRTILGADNRAGVAVVLETLQTVVENNLPHPPIYCAFSVAEEIGMFGIKFIPKEKINAACGFVFDSSAKPGDVIVNAPSSRVITIKLFGKAAHAAVQPENGVNALKIAGNAISKIPTGKFNDNSTFNFGTIKGGKAINIVPDYVEIEAEYRGFSHKLLDRKVENLRQVFNSEAESLGGKAEIEVVEKYGFFELSESSETVKIAFNAIRKADLNPEAITYSGGSDANVLNTKGIPTVNFGMGFRNVHSVNEYIKTEDLYKDAEIAMNIVTASYS